jgi:hypothetical protein
VYAIATVQRITRTGCMGITFTAESGKRAEIRSSRTTSQNIQRESAPVTQTLSRTALHREPLSGTIPQVVYDAPNYRQYQ